MDADAATIEELLRERAWLRRLAGALARDAATADDLAQQTYVAALERAPRRVRSPRAWLATVVRNLARDRARSEGRRTKREADRPPREPIPTPDELAARAELIERVGRRVLALEEPYREALLLRYYEDLPPRRIAAHLGIPVETVRTRIKRALAKLGRSLDAEHGGDRRTWAVPLLLWGQPPDPSFAALWIGGVVVKKMIAAFVLLVVGLFLAAEWLPRLSERGASPEQGSIPWEEPGPVGEPGAPVLRGAADVEDTDVGPSAPAPLPWALVGRVLYPGRVPAAGARVRLFAGTSATEADDVGITDGKGRFRLHPRGPLEDGLRMFRLTAEDGEGNVASRERWNVEVPRAEDVDAGRLTLEPGHTLRVRVESEGAPVSGARVAIFDAGYVHHAAYGALATDDRGHASMEGLLPLLYRVDVSAESLTSEVVLVSLPQLEGEPYAIVLDPPRTVEVEVVEAPEMRPLSGVEVRVFRHVTWWNTYRNHALPALAQVPVTDARGRTRIAGIGRSPHLHLGVLARGYARPSFNYAKKTWTAHCRKTVPIPPDEDVVRIVVPSARRVTWPLVEGDAPIPPEGSVVELVLPVTNVGVQAGMRPFGVETGVVEDGRLVVDGLVEGYFTVRGRTPGGLVARIVALPGETEGAPLAFWRPRTLEVVLRDKDGVPLPKISVKLEASDGPQISTPFAHTNVEGVARWTDLPAIRGTIRPNAPPHASLTVDLTKGDQRIQATAETPEERRQYPLAIRVRLGGRPGLPDVYRLELAEYESDIRLEREEEESATLYARWAPSPGRDGARFVLAASGFQSAPFGVTTDTTEVEVDLEAGCELRVAFLHDAGQRLRCHLERFDSGARSWQRETTNSSVRPGSNLKSLNPPAVGHERTFERLPPGRYRIVDDRTNRTSDVVSLVVGEPAPRITFDCRPASEVKGRVVVPGGHVAEEAIVQVLFGDEVKEIRVDAKGHFAFPWPADAASIRLVARHPLLGPDGLRGEAVLSAPREGLHLELTPGPIAEIELRVSTDGEDRLLPSRATRVHLWSAGKPAETATLLPARLEGKEGGVWLLTFGGYEVGNWSLWCDVGHGHAPLRLENVELDEMDPVLGPVTLTKGSTIRIRAERPRDEAVDLLVATAKYEGRPFHQRMSADTDVTELVLTGLEAGRYHVTGGPVDPILDEPPTALDEVIEVDGRSDYERVIRVP